MKLKLLFSILLFGVLALMSVGNSVSAQESGDTPTEEVTQLAIENQVSLVADNFIVLDVHVKHTSNYLFTLNGKTNEALNVVETSIRDVFRHERLCYQAKCINKINEVPLKQMPINYSMAFSC
jgi:hypothetical protein